MNEENKNDVIWATMIVMFVSVIAGTIIYCGHYSDKGYRYCMTHITPECVQYLNLNNN